MTERLYFLAPFLDFAAAFFFGVPVAAALAAFEVFFIAADCFFFATVSFTAAEAPFLGAAFLLGVGLAPFDLYRTFVASNYPKTRSTYSSEPWLDEFITNISLKHVDQEQKNNLCRFYNS